MYLKINGKSENIDSGNSITEIIRRKKLSPDKVILEYNLKVLPKNDWDKVIPKENDTLEIISFVAGG